MNLAPSLFISHGSPMLALDSGKTNEYVKFLESIKLKINEKPKAILFMSAHWNTNSDKIDLLENEELIYDFYGFPRELYQIKYSIKGFSEGFELVNGIFGYEKFSKEKRGPDHGVWTILKHIYDENEIPIFILSINRKNTFEDFFLLGEKLKDLRKQGIMIVGSGNLVHNLGYIDFSLKNTGYNEAHTFLGEFKKALKTKEYNLLFDPHKFEGGEFSVPTFEHYIPAIFILGTFFEDEKVEIYFDDFELGSISRTLFGVGI